MQTIPAAPVPMLVTQPYAAGGSLRPPARSMAWLALRSLLLIATATTLILVLLPAALDAVAARALYLA